MSYSRFAIYYVPSSGSLATFGTAWLGWDVEHGRDTPQFDLPGLHDITMTPRRYGFHATLKPPFRLADGMNIEDLSRAISKMVASAPPVTCAGLKLTALGRFLAVTPRGNIELLQNLAANCVRTLDRFRAPATGLELENRRKAGLTVWQEALLRQWGYPYVLEEFRFHLTLTGQLPKDSVPIWMERVERYLPKLPKPFMVDQIALCGEREDRKFELLHRFQLTG